MRILMLGNSLTTANGLPDLLASRLDAEVTVHARGGARLSEHLNPHTKLGAKTQQALAGGSFDFLIMQEMSNGPVTSPARFLESVNKLAQAARESGAQPILYATWAYAPTCTKLEKLGMSYGQMHDAMHQAALDASRESGASLADVCLAFHAHEHRQQLYQPDGIHPSPEGTLVALEQLVSTIEGCNKQRVCPTYQVYLLRCEDGSYYTGITTDAKRRYAEHLSQGPKAARYTRTHRVVALEATWEAADRAEASRIEYRIKRFTHAQKQALAQNPELLQSFLAQ